MGRLKEEPPGVGHVRARVLAQRQPDLAEEGNSCALPQRWAWSCGWRTVGTFNQPRTAPPPPLATLQAQAARVKEGAGQRPHGMQALSWGHWGAIAEFRAGEDSACFTYFCEGLSCCQEGIKDSKERGLGGWTDSERGANKIATRWDVG